MLSRLDHIVKNLVEQIGCDSLLQAHYDESCRWCFKLSHVTLMLTDDGQYLKCEILDNELQIHRKILDPLRQQVRHVIDAANGGELPKNNNALLAVLFDALECLLDFELTLSSKGTATSKKLQKWRADEEFDTNLYTENPFGLDLSSVTDTAYQFLGKTTEQLCESMPPEFRVIHVETILRTDLVHRFDNYRLKLRNDLQIDNVTHLRHSMAPHSKLAERKILSTLPKNDIVDDMLTPRVTYHGTMLANVSSIVRHGFKMPGSNIEGGKIVASPRTGTVYNRGIYSSQAAFYALSYAARGRQATPLGDLPALRLFVCATVMGRTLSGKGDYGRSELVHGHLVDGYDSHFDGGYEYIVHHPEAMLPCYVIHLDLGSEMAKRAVLDAQKDPRLFDCAQTNAAKLHTKLNRRDLAPGDFKRIAEAKKAAALKWFPNGFGTAKGTSFIIEEIGEVDDDEEEYGEWQAERHGFFREEEGGGSWMDGEDLGGIDFYEDYDEDGNKIIVRNGNGLDLYQAARRTGASRR